MKKNEEIRSQYPWKKIEWATRSKLIASRIPPGARVIDLGGGYGTLTRFLPQVESYTSIDLKPWTDRTVVGDFNASQFPDVPQGSHVVAQGILEYIHDPLGFLKQIRKYGPALALSYRLRPDNEVFERNDYQFEQIKQFLIAAGWNVDHAKYFGKRTEIFFCSRV